MALDDLSETTIKKIIYLCLAVFAILIFSKLLGYFLK
jgi:hypothetical protein